MEKMYSPEYLCIYLRNSLASWALGRRLALASYALHPLIPRFALTDLPLRCIILSCFASLIALSTLNVYVSIRCLSPV